LKRGKKGGGVEVIGFAGIYAGFGDLQAACLKANSKITFAVPSN
jgi:hypothetical protein